MDACEKAQQLVDALPFTVAGLVRDPPFVLAEAVAAAKALEGFYSDPTTGCLVLIKTGRSPYPYPPSLPTAMPNPLEQAEQRGRLLLGLVQLLDEGALVPGSGDGALAPYLFGRGLRGIELGLRSEIDKNVRIGWLAAASLTTLAGIEDAVMDLAEDDPVRVRAAALVVLSNAPGDVVRTYSTRLRQLASLALAHDDLAVSVAGRKLLGWIQIQTAGSPPATTPSPARPTRPQVLSELDTADVVLGSSFIGAVLLLGAAALRRSRA